MPVPADRPEVALTVTVDAEAMCRFTASTPGPAQHLGPAQQVGPAFPAGPGHWVGATLGLFAMAPPEPDGPPGPASPPVAFAEFDRFTLTPAWK